MAGFTIAAAMGISAIVGGATSIYSQRKSGQAQQQAFQGQERAADAELSFLGEQAQLDRDERAEARAAAGGGGEGLALQREMFEYQKRLQEERDARAKPYREYGVRQLGALSALTNARGGG